MADPLQELLAAGARADDVVPADEPLRGRAAWTRGTRATGTRRCRSCAAGFCPRAERFSLLYEVPVVEGDRRDVLAARHVGDAALWWRLADANGVVDPRALTDRVGLAGPRITLPEDVPGSSDG